MLRSYFQPFPSTSLHPPPRPRYCHPSSTQSAPGTRPGGHAAQAAGRPASGHRWTGPEYPVFRGGAEQGLTNVPFCMMVHDKHSMRSAHHGCEARRARATQLCPSSLLQPQPVWGRGHAEAGRMPASPPAPPAQHAPPATSGHWVSASQPAVKREATQAPLCPSTDRKPQLALACSLVNARTQQICHPPCRSGWGRCGDPPCGA